MIDHRGLGERKGRAATTTVAERARMAGSEDELAGGEVRGAGSPEEAQQGVQLRRSWRQ